MITACRYHDSSCGHRVHGHGTKCANLHGHNYRIHFHCEAGALDRLGRVIDFAVIKITLCQWLEDNWDHRTLLWEDDPIAPALRQLDGTVVIVPSNPTAENIALHMVEVRGPECLAGAGVRLVRYDGEETRKCSASCSAEC